MDIKELHSSWNDEAPYRISKALKFDDLITAIEYLDENEIVSLESFSELSDQERKAKYFGMAHPTSIKKAITKISDKKAGISGLSTHTAVTATFSKNGESRTIKVDFL